MICENTGRRWELRARVASGVLFAAAFVGLSLPWEPVEARDEILAIRPGRQSGLDMIVNRVTQSEWSDVVFAAMAVFLVAAPVIGLRLSFRDTRKAAVVRAILAFVSVMPFAFVILLSFGLTGSAPTWSRGGSRSGPSWAPLSSTSSPRPPGVARRAVGKDRTPARPSSRKARDVRTRLRQRSPAATHGAFADHHGRYVRWSSGARSRCRPIERRKTRPGSARDRGRRCDRDGSVG